MMSTQPIYSQGAQLTAVSYKKEKLIGQIFYYQPRQGPKMLVKVYKKINNHPQHPGVAIMDAVTHIHVGYPSITRLYRAHRIFDTDDALLDLLSSLQCSHSSDESDSL